MSFEPEISSTSSLLVLKLSATVRTRHTPKKAVQLIAASCERVILLLPPEFSAGQWIWLDILGVGSRYVRVNWRLREMAEVAFAAPVDDALLRATVHAIGEWTERDAALLHTINVICRDTAEDCPTPSTKIMLLRLALRCRATVHVRRLISDMARRDAIEARTTARLDRVSVAAPRGAVLALS